MEYSTIRGISVVFDGYDFHLTKLFDGINLTDFLWYITNSEVYWQEDVNEDLLAPGVYDGCTLLSILKKSPCHMIHARIFAVPIGANLLVNKIDDYVDFLESNCEIGILCADCIAEVYVKSQNLLGYIIENGQKHYKSSMLFITDANDARTSFYI